MNSNKQLNNVNFAGAKNEHPPSQNAGVNGRAAANAPQAQHGANAHAQLNANQQAQKLKTLVKTAQNGSTQALEELCIMFEPLFRKEMRREIFYNALGWEEGLSLARLRFI